MIIKKLNKIFVIYFFSIFIFFSNLTYASILEITDDDFVIGSKDAPITIIEYSSLSCIHCANFHNNTLPQIKEEYIDTGKVRFIFRDFPLNMPALVGSMILRCVPSEMRYDYMNVLFYLRNNWVISDNAKSTKELYKIMQSGGMTKEEFDICLKNDQLGDKIIKERMDAQKKFSIQSTPSFIVNGVLVSGEKSIKEFRQIIDQILTE